MENTNEYVLAAVNELTRDVERLNNRIRRVRFMNKVYFGVSLYYAYRLWKENKKEKEETNKE